MIGNYQQYIERMTKSFDKTTKSLIPYYALQMTRGIEKPRILDVGIGSGVVGQAIRQVLPEAVICGIDMVQKNIDDAPEGIYDELYCVKLQEIARVPMKMDFDVVIFSSVLHEIGSYAERDRFAIYHIIEALKITHSILKEGGHVIIRDGLASSYQADVPLSLRTKEDFAALRRFIEERPMAEFDAYSREELMRRLDEDPLRMPNNVIREFLCTWTWGPASWPREVEERFCYMTFREWQKSIGDAGFRLTVNVESYEEYPRYFAKIVEGYELDTPIIGVFVGEKAEE